MNDAERDAWLREALRHAPDVDAVPPRGVSEAILSKARAQARARPSRVGATNGLAAFWDWLARPPIAAGFASVMAATLVGLMWWDRPMDETMPRPPAAIAERNGAAPPLASAAPATVAATPPARTDATASTTPSENKASVKAAADDSDMRRQRSEPKPSLAADAKGVEPAATAEKRKVDSFAKERGFVAQEKNETPAPFPAAPSEREAHAAKPLDAAAADAAKKSDESRRSRATDAIEGAAGPPIAQSRAPTPAPAARPSPPDVATASATPSPAPAPTTTSPPGAAPAPFSEFASRQGALGDLRTKDTAGVAVPAPTQAAAPSTAQLRSEAERTQLERAKQAESLPSAGAATNAVAAARANTTAQADSPLRTGSVVAATPLAGVLAAIAADPARWSRRTAAGRTVALDAAWRAWLSELDAAAAGRWRALDGADVSDADAKSDSAAGRDGATTLRLFSDGRLAAVVRVDAAIVQLDAAPSTGRERWQARLSPAGAEGLRTTSRRLAP